MLLDRLDNKPRLNRMLLGAAVAGCIFCNGAAFAGESWQLRYQRWQDSSIDPAVAGDDSSVDRAEYFLAYQWQNPHGAERLSYAHQPVLIRAGEPAHNGYFHRLDLSYESTIDRVEVAVSGGLHGSSNMFNHAQFHGDALVVSAAAMYPLSQSTGKIGFAGDHRFGHFRLYPQYYREFAFDNGRSLVVNLPAYVHWWLSPRRWQVGVESYGEKWGALDSEREIESAFYLREYRLLSRWQWHTGGDARQWQLTVGISFDTRVEYLDLQRGWRDQQLDRALFAAVRAQFGE